MATATDEQVRGAHLGLLDRFPWRRIILIILSIVIVSVVAIGAYKTLTLPADERYTATTWKNFIVLGLAQGAIIGLIALGYTLVYGILRMINFAHGEVFMFGAFGAFFFADAWEAERVLGQQPDPVDGAPPRDRDADVDGRRRPAGADRLSSAAQRASARAAHHGDRRLAVPRRTPLAASSGRRAAGSASRRRSRAPGRSSASQVDRIQVVVLVTVIIAVTALCRCSSRGPRPGSRCAPSPPTARSRA